MTVRVLSGKDQLRVLVFLAKERFNHNESFSDEEVMALFGGLQAVFGDDEASGFLNLVVKICQRYNGKITFNRAVVETIGKCIRAGGGPE